MMVETMLESSQDFGMSNGSLPLWKRELLQRRASRPRPPPPPTAPPPPPPTTADEDEELRYGPGIVKRLQSRYLSLALREAPKRRSSVLRRATSLEHLLDEPQSKPDPAPRPARPISLAITNTSSPGRRESIKRARSVDALSRLERRPPERVERIAEPVIAPEQNPPQSRNGRPPRRPQPLLRETERPPPDLVKSALRKFEPCAHRRTPAARVAAVLRGLEVKTQNGRPITSTPEPSPGRIQAVQNCNISTIDEPEGNMCSATIRAVSPTALEGIAKAGSTMRFSFPTARVGSHLPPLGVANPVLARRVGVIRPLPPVTPPPTSPVSDQSSDIIVIVSPVTDEEPFKEKMESSPTPIIEAVFKEIQIDFERKTLVTPERSPSVSPAPVDKPEIVKPEIITNGHKDVEIEKEEVKLNGKVSRISAAKIERGWNSASVVSEEKSDEVKCEVKGVWAGRKPRAAPPPATSVVFNFSNRKEVPDYIENDGVILRASRREKIKAGDPGVVVLREPTRSSDTESDEELEEPTPCAVRFVNDNVLINGKSSLLGRPNKDRVAKLKLQFDDSLTRTFEYPSETSLCEEDSPAAPPSGNLGANTHIVSAALSGYTPSKTKPDDFQLGLVAWRPDAESKPASPPPEPAVEPERSWSESRHRTDLLF